ncbi:conserved Plasmodium protein, unknown function [Plasmodium ovale]|uniref:Uncharacterized protein n=2 Tax=Plasmodium ovale TaxID=36330 RepID=A0A1A8VQC8_PLAOA|nr:conserved Plasmodium protein, unknown function [Plasmodium ovale curtisi]SBS81012.1 conserved Plasmodium protein, unknown function [Plasmodium ovale curtisi]SCA48442.1 conserved Plasmodium protein, unknown function [Plasmodium ovale]
MIYYLTCKILLKGNSVNHVFMRKYGNLYHGLLCRSTVHMRYCHVRRVGEVSAVVEVGTASDLGRSILLQCKKGTRQSMTYSADNTFNGDLFGKRNKKQKTQQQDDEKLKKCLYYPESTHFPYVTVCIILGMVGISSFFEVLIYKLRNCDDEEGIMIKVDKILKYLDRYFIMYNWGNGDRRVSVDKRDISGVGKMEALNAYQSNIFSVKHLTSQFFINENVLQCSVQLCTFFLASRFLEKHYGSPAYFALFLFGSIFSNAISSYFFTYLKKVESLKLVDFVVIHPSGSMAFICAVCSICFKNCGIWKNVPIHCSTLVVPFLLSSFYGLLSLHKIKKQLSANVHEENVSGRNDTLENTELAVESKSEESSKVDGITYNKIYEETRADSIEGEGNYIMDSISEGSPSRIPIQYNQNDVLNTLRNFLIVKACDSVMKKRKKENMFLNKKIQNLKRETLKNINEISNKSQKIFFGISSSFTDTFGIILASTFFFLRFLK